MRAYQWYIRASSLRRSTELISAAISADVAGRLASNFVKIDLTWDTVTAGVFRHSSLNTTTF